MHHKRGYPRSRRPHSCFCKGKWAKVVEHEPKVSDRRRMAPAEDWLPDTSGPIDYDGLAELLRLSPRVPSLDHLLDH